MVKRKENTTENTGAENTAGGSKKEMSNSVFVGLILLGISVLCMLILFGAFKHTRKQCGSLICRNSPL